MLRNFIILLAAIGVLILMLGICIKAIQPVTLVKRSVHGKTLYCILDSVTSLKYIKKPLDFLARNKENPLNRKLSKILELSEAGISLRQVYFLKLVSLAVCAVLVVIIGYTNMEYRTRRIIEAPGNERQALYSSNTYRQFNYPAYKEILNGIGKAKLAKANSSDIYDVVWAQVSDDMDTADSQIIEEKTEWFVNKWNEVNTLKPFGLYHILILILSIFIPELLCITRWLLRGCIYKREIIKLEYIFELLARIDGIKTLDIIYELEKSSGIYAKYLREFAKQFKYDKRKGLDYLRGRNIKSLAKLINVLEIYCFTDKKIALQVLEREAMERDEAMIFTAEETLDFIDLVAFLCIIPIVYELARLMLMPMLDIVYKAFEVI